MMIALMSYAQPVPQLLYHKTQPAPAFISVSGLSIDFIDTQDYIFTYTADSICAGSYKVFGDPCFVIASGKDQWSPGFSYREQINIGIYDSQSNKFYKIEGKTKDWNNNTVQPFYMALNMLRFEITNTGDEMTLKVDSALSASELKYTRMNKIIDVYKDANLFFNVVSKNMTDVQTSVVQGGGTVEVVDRWIKDHFVNSLYKAVDTDEIVVIKTTGQDVFTGEAKEAWATVQVINSKPATPEPVSDTGTMLYSCDRFKLVKKELKNFGDFIFIESLTDYPVWVQLSFYKSDGKRVSSILRSDSNGGRGISLKGMEKAIFYRGWFDGKAEPLKAGTITF